MENAEGRLRRFDRLAVLRLGGSGFQKGDVDAATVSFSLQSGWE